MLGCRSVILVSRLVARQGPAAVVIAWTGPTPAEEKEGWEKFTGGRWVIGQMVVGVSHCLRLHVLYRGPRGGVLSVVHASVPDISHVPGRLDVDTSRDRNASIQYGLYAIDPPYDVLTSAECPSNSLARPRQTWRHGDSSSPRLCHYQHECQWHMIQHAPVLVLQ